MIQRKSFQLLVLGAIAITGGSVLVASARKSPMGSGFLGASAPTAAAPSAVPVTVERLDPAVDLLNSSGSDLSPRTHRHTRRCR